MTLHDLDIKWFYVLHQNHKQPRKKKEDNLDFNKIKSFYVSENIIKKVKK